MVGWFKKLTEKIRSHSYTNPGKVDQKGLIEFEAKDKIKPT